MESVNNSNNLENNVENTQNTQNTSVSQTVAQQVTHLDSDVIDENLQKIYNTCSSLIRRAIGGQPFTPESISFVIATITRAIQDFSQMQPSKLTGVEKQAIALNLTKHILKDFRDNGQLSEQAYQDILIAVTVVGPTLVNLVVSSWKKAVSTGEDIAAHGCKNCVKRNFC
jgi:hypothetical protein